MIAQHLPASLQRTVTQVELYINDFDEVYIMISCHVAASLDFGLLNVGCALMSELSGAWPFSLSVTRGLPHRYF